MCEANAYLLKEGKEELILEAVDILEQAEEGKIRLANIFGEQKVLDAKFGCQIEEDVTGQSQDRPRVRKKHFSPVPPR